MSLQRTVRRAATLAAAAGLTLTFVSAGTLASADTAAPAPTGAPPTVTGADIKFTHPSQTLSTGTAEDAGLNPYYIDRIGPDITKYLAPNPTPEYPGAVALAAHDGVVVANKAVGYALKYADDKPTLLPESQWIAMTPNTIFDLASMTKLFTSIAAVQLIEQGKIGLDTSVAQYIPAFAANGKSDITIRNLLTHTSGLPADPSPSLCTYANNDQRWAAVYAVKPFAPPNTTYLYSDMNMMTLGKVIETVTGKTLDQVVAENITQPLGMSDTMFNPPASLKPRIAAEEYQPWTNRGIVWGTVHDENAYCVGGVSGHAGLFSTTHDLSILAQTLLNGGRYGHVRILDEDSTRLLFTNQNQAFPGDSHGLGFELDQRWYMDALNSPVSAGHTGYTGTDIVLDPLSNSFVILLTNRVHPSRYWASQNPSRRAVARDLAYALPVKPSEGQTAWFSGDHDATTANLSIPVSVPADGAALSFDLWYDTEETDIGTLQASSDGGNTWQSVPLTLRVGSDQWQTDGSFSGFEGRQWLKAAAQLPGGTTNVRWRYATDALYLGRGVYVDRVRVVSPEGLLFNDSRPADAGLFQASGWQPATS